MTHFFHTASQSATAAMVATVHSSSSSSACWSFSFSAADGGVSTFGNSVLDCGAGVSAGAAAGNGGDCGTGVEPGGGAMSGRCRLNHWFVDGGVQLSRVAVPKTILPSSLRMLSSLRKECTFPDSTADQCADQARTACHANLSACRRRTPERTRRDTSLESADPSRSGRSPSACTYLFGEKGPVLWNRHTWERRILVKSFISF